MITPKKPVTVTYMCTWCGATITRSTIMGRPLPGVCPVRPKLSNGKGAPHRWVVSKRY